MGIVSSFFALFIAKDVLHFTLPEIQSFIFLKLSVAGHQTLFVTRTRACLLLKTLSLSDFIDRHPLDPVIAALFVGFGILVTAVPWNYIGLIWAYTLVWMFIADRVKIVLMRRV